MMFKRKANPELPTNRSENKSIFFQKSNDKTLNSCKLIYGLSASLLVVFCCLAKGTAGAAPVQMEGSAAPDLNPVKVHSVPAGKETVLVKDGQPQAKIYVALTQGETGYMADRLKEAVSNLVKYIEKATGAKLPVVYEKPEGTMIVVGDCETARKAGVDVKKMPVEGFAIKTFRHGIVLAGYDRVVNTQNTPDKEKQGLISVGTAWAVSEFLERFVGIRWYWPGELGTSIPKNNDLIIKPIYLTDAPVFRKRAYWPKPVTMLRNASSWPMQIRVHQSANYVASYKENRPEIYQLKKDGKRDFKQGLYIGETGQKLCYSNPLTLKTYIEAIDRVYKTGKLPGIPDYRLPDNFAITVSPTDSPVECQGKRCQANWNKGGGSPASYIMADFVARLAREAKKRWPGKKIMYLPYSNYAQPPQGVEFPDNVEIEYCVMPGLAMYKEPNIIEREQKTIDTWSEMTGRKISTWQYLCWPEDQTKAAYLFPHVIQDFYRKNKDKIIGSHINGVPYMDHMRRQHLSFYIWSKVLWNPEFPVDEAISEYCRRMFGPAAPAMRKLVQMQIDGWEKNQGLKGEFNDNNRYKISLKSIYTICYPREDVIAMEKILKQAIKMTNNDELVRKRLEYYAAPLEDFFAESVYVSVSDHVEEATLKLNEFLQDINKQKTNKNRTVETLRREIMQKCDKFIAEAKSNGKKDISGLRKCLELITQQIVAIPRTKRMPKIDGKIGVREWQGASQIDNFALRCGTIPYFKYDTTVNLSYDEQFLYLAFICKEKNLDELITEYKTRDGKVWRDDALEIFLLPSPGTDTYYQFIVNSAGALFDCSAPNFVKDMKWSSSTKVAASLNKKNNEWLIEMAVPWKDIGFRPESGSVMRGNFFRDDRYNKRFSAISTSWSPYFHAFDQTGLGIMVLE